ncbi:hypothetical protein [Sphaerisporangium flaviroseum]
MKRYGMGALAALTLAASVGAAPATALGQRWEPSWSPDPRIDGVGAFEALEDDRRGSHPEGLPHVYVQGNAYRFDAHLEDRDGSDRMRNESRGMRTRNGRKIEIREDETWRISYQMYIPDTLHATPSFTHIWQLKAPDVSTPLAQLSLPIVNGVPKIQARYWEVDDSVHEVGAADLAPIQNKWVTTTLEFKSGDDGYLRWVLQDGKRTLADKRVDHIDLWFSDEGYNRPKWGVYRSIRSAGLEETYLLVRDLKAWRLGPRNPVPSTPPPDRGPGAYEAERVGNVFEGAAEPARCGVCSGGHKVLLTGGNIYDYTVIRGVLSETTGARELTVHALVDGAQTFFVSVNGADAIQVPMSGNKEAVSTATVQVPLVAGVNTLRFYNLSARTPELDKIVIR